MKTEMNYMTEIHSAAAPADGAEAAEINVIQALHDILDDAGRPFLSLSTVRVRMGVALRNQLGITEKNSGKSVQEILTPYLLQEDEGSRLDVWKARNNSLYLVVKSKCEPRALVLDRIIKNPGKSPGTLISGLPISTQDFLRQINDLLDEGIIRATVVHQAGYGIRLYCVRPQNSSAS